MDKEKCKICVCSKDSELHTNSVCEICYRIDEIGNGFNYYFIKKIDKPIICKECIYCQEPQQPFLDIYVCKASQSFNKDDRYIFSQSIRKNYLKKGTPKWCPLN